MHLRNVYLIVHRWLITAAGRQHARPSQTARRQTSRRALRAARVLHAAFDDRRVALATPVVEHLDRRVRDLDKRPVGRAPDRAVKPKDEARLRGTSAPPMCPRQSVRRFRAAFSASPATASRGWVKRVGSPLVCRRPAARAPANAFPHRFGIFSSLPPQRRRECAETAEWALQRPSAHSR